MKRETFATARTEVSNSPPPSPSSAIACDMGATILEQDRIIWEETRMHVSSRLEFELLLELYRAEHAGQRSCEWDICQAAAAPTSTAYRRMRALIDRGLVLQEKPAGDRRRVEIRLSDRGDRLVGHVLARIRSPGKHL